MSQVFISYSSKNKQQTQELVTAIEAELGASTVWWDVSLEARAPFAPQIKQALEAASVVVVIWSHEATLSDFVYSEASYASRARKLVNVRPANVEVRCIPQPFDVHQIEDLDNIDRIVQTILKVCRGISLPKASLHELYHRHFGEHILNNNTLESSNSQAFTRPAELLHAKYQLVGFTDPANTCKSLMTWCLQSENRADGRLIYGAGGMGKTRLAIELATRLRTDHNWSAGFLSKRPTDDVLERRWWQALDHLISSHDEKGILIIIDYAESRQKDLEQIASRLRKAPLRKDAMCRIVLLARSAGDWWQSLTDRESDVLFLIPPQIGLIPIAPIHDDIQRWRYFASCVGAFLGPMQSLGFDKPKTEPRSQLMRIANNTTYSKPLAIQMEALLWLAGASTDGNAHTLHDLLRGVLALEQKRSEEINQLQSSKDSFELMRALAQITSAQGASDRQSIIDLLVQDTYFAGQRISPIHVHELVDALLRSHGQPGETIPPLEPDILGEHLVATYADTRLIDSCIKWIEHQPEREQQPRLHHLVTVLQRATTAEHGADTAGKAEQLLNYIIKTHLKRLASPIINVLSETPGSLNSLLQKALPALGSTEITTLADSLPEKHVGLIELSVLIHRHLVQEMQLDLHERHMTVSQETYVECSYSLVVRLNNLAAYLQSENQPSAQQNVSEEIVLIFEKLKDVAPTWSPNWTQLRLFAHHLRNTKQTNVAIELLEAAFSQAKVEWDTMQWRGDTTTALLLFVDLAAAHAEGGNRDRALRARPEIS